MDHNDRAKTDLQAAIADLLHAVADSTQYAPAAAKWRTAAQETETVRQRWLKTEDGREYTARREAEAKLIADAIARRTAAGKALLG